jgi:Cu/Ag efflux protein CusF
MIWASAAFTATWSCARKNPNESAENRYSLEGTVIRLDPKTKLATIQHRAISDANGRVWMDAMTMDFPVRQESEFNKLKSGQKIRATVHQRESDFDYWISGIHECPECQ